MDNEFSHYELLMIRQNVNKMPVSEIAELIDVPVETLQPFIDELASKDKSIVPWVPKPVKVPKPPREPKPRVIREKKPVNPRAPIIPKPERVRIPKPKKEKKITSARKRTVVTVLPKKKEKAFETIDRNFDEMVTVRIDEKTVIYIKKGEDRQAAIDKYKKAHEKPPLTAEEELAKQQRLIKKARLDAIAEKKRAKYDSYYRD